MPTNRRRFLCEGTLALAGVTAGAVTIFSGCGSSGLATSRVATGSRTVGFGWAINGLSGGGAYAYFKVASEVALDTVNIDGSFVPSMAAATTSFAQVLCQGWVSRGAMPTFGNDGGNAASARQASKDFGAITIYNPNNLVLTCDGAPLQDVFYSAILKTWVPADRADSATSRAVSGRLSLMLHDGDYLVFSIDHAGGVPGDVEMQVAFGYS
jgi:hypothetical protein